MIRPDELDIDENTPLSPQRTVFKATFTNDVVAVKILSQEVTTSNLHASTANWNTLIHPNILKFIGVCSVDADPPFIVTEYQELGNVQEYLEHHPNVDRPQLILDVAHGMQYLHSRGVTHGSLKTSDILVNVSGEACIADYCMTQIQTSKSNNGHRYFSPEAWKGITSKTSDIYAFAMCALEIFTSTPPWGVLPEKHIVRMVMHEDTRPDRPDHALSLRVGLNDQMWDVIEESWHKEPRLRPTFDIIVRVWQAAISGNLLPSNGRGQSQSWLKPLQVMNPPEHFDDDSEDAPPPAYSTKSNPSVAEQAYRNRDAKTRTSPHAPPRNQPIEPLSINKNKRPYHSPSPSAPAGVQTFPNSASPPSINVELSSPTMWQSLPPSRASAQYRGEAQPQKYGYVQPGHEEADDDVGMSLYASTSTSPGSVYRRETTAYREEEPGYGSDSVRRQTNVSRRSLMPANVPRKSKMTPSMYSSDPEPTSGVHRVLTLTDRFSGHSNDDMQTISDIGSVNGLSRINPVLMVGALQAEIKAGQNPQAIDEYLLKIDHLSSQSEKVAQKLITAGVMPMLILLLKRRAVSDHPGLDTVLMTLGTLACDSVSANTIYRTDTATTLIELFTSSESDDIAGLSMWIVCRMSRTPEIAQGLIKTGLVKELVNRGLKGGPRAAALSAWCIGSLVHTDSIADNLADRHFIIPDLVDHLRHTTNLGANATPLNIASGLFAIARMARSIRLAKALAKAGCVDLLAHHLNTSSDPNVLNWSARAVGCLMRPNSSDMSKILLEKGVAGGLARMPRVLPQDEVEPLASFAFAIQRFSCAEWGGGTRKALVDAGVVDSLLAALRTAADEPYPQVHIELALAVSFLGDVGGAVIRKEIVNAGGVKILKEISKEAIGTGRGDEVAKACNMAATSITGNIWTRNAASAKTALSHNWSGGCPEYHPPCPLKFQLYM